MAQSVPLMPINPTIRPNTTPDDALDQWVAELYPFYASGADDLLTRAVKTSEMTPARFGQITSVVYPTQRAWDQEKVNGKLSERQLKIRRLLNWLNKLVSGFLLSIPKWAQVAFFSNGFSPPDAQLPLFTEQGEFVKDENSEGKGEMDHEGQNSTNVVQHASSTAVSQDHANLKIPSMYASKAYKSLGNRFSEVEMQFAAQCLSPFAHMTTISLPSRQSTSTITEHRTYVKPIQRPSSIPAGTPWGFHGWTCPDAINTVDGNGAPYLWENANLTGSLVTAHPSTTANGHLFNKCVFVVVCYTMEEYNRNAPGFQTGLTMAAMCGLPADRFYRFTAEELTDTQTASALTGLSFKVLNTSSVLTQKGSIQVYRQPTYVSQNSITAARTTITVQTRDSPGEQTDPLSGLVQLSLGGIQQQLSYLTPPPEDSSQAQQLGAVIDLAKEGCIAVQPYNYVKKLPVCATSQNFAYLNDIASATPNETFITGSKLATVNVQDTPVGVAPNVYVADAAVATISTMAESRTGVFVNNQGDDSTFDIVVHAIITRQPVGIENANNASSALLPYASKPPIYRDEFMEALTAAADSLPIAMEAKANSIGSFFKNALKGFTDAADKIAPLTSMLPGRVGTASRAYSAVRPVLYNDTKLKRAHREETALHHDLTRKDKIIRDVAAKEKSSGNRVVCKKVIRNGKALWEPV